MSDDLRKFAESLIDSLDTLATNAQVEFLTPSEILGEVAFAVQQALNEVYPPKE